MSGGGIRVYLVKAFGNDAQGGNPAGVVLEADGMSAGQKQAIAKKIGYSETAFVGRSDKADFRVDFFTPLKQIPNCGHATVATFALLRQKKIVKADEATVETLNGLGSVRFEGEAVFMEQRPAGQWRLSSAEEAEFLESLGLERSGLLSAFTPRVVSTGNKFFLLGVGGTRELAGLRPDFSKISALSSRHAAVGYYAFALASEGFAATTRMFAPYFGINEESATGMAAGPLAWMLRDEFGLPGEEYLIEQGRFMELPSLSIIRARVLPIQGKTRSLLIGGKGFIVSETSVALG